MKEKEGKERNEKRMKKKLLSWCIVLSMVLTAVPLMVTTIIPEKVGAVPPPPSEGIEVPTLRVYGNASEGAGDTSVDDPITSSVIEDLPYTDAIAPFNPQHPQAPVKDSITFNPVYLSETLSNDELLGEPPLPAGPYDDRIKRGGQDAEEKIYLRQWYEPWHWDKDVDGDGEWWVGDRDDFEEFMRVFQWIRHLPPYVLQGKEEIHFTSPIVNFSETLPLLDPDDEIYPAIMQEYTYLLVEPQYHQPTYGTPGNTFFVFPIGVKEEDINSPFGYGLTSLDYNFDGTPDTVTVHSEKTLFAKTKIAADFDGGQSIDPIDPDGYELTGDEMVILSTGPAKMNIGDKWQFLDHMIKIEDTYTNPPAVKLAIWYMGDLEPEFLGYQLLGQYDMALVGRKLPVTYIEAVANGGLGANSGGSGTNLCDFPTGPWFVWSQSVHPAGGYAYIMIGRALGHTHTAMENGSYEQDLTHRDPWNLKRFYVDGHEYNVVAIETYRGVLPQHDWEDSEPWNHEDTNWHYFNQSEPWMVNDLDCAWNTTEAEATNNKIEGPPGNTTIDDTGFKYITIRTPIPKAGERQNHVTGEIEYAYRDKEYSYMGEDDATIRNWGYYHLIEQHSIRLQPYFINDYLPVLPPYNYEHSIAIDIQKNWSALRNDPDDELTGYGNPEHGWKVPPQWIGDIEPKVPPITQKVGDYITYDQRTIDTEQMLYVDEDINPQYKGELKEIYNEGDDYPTKCGYNGPKPDEWWYVEQWHTLPDMYTEFVLPEGNGDYLLTSAFTSDESYGRILNQEKRGDAIDQIITIWDGNRVKFWFDPTNYVRDPQTNEILNKGDLKKYKCEDGLRIYGFDSEGAGDYSAIDPKTSMVPENKPYTDPQGPFVPQHEQAPRKDHITFDSAYMDQYHNGGENLSELYKWLSIEESDAREKVFHRMWYEPWHWAKDVNGDKDMYGIDIPDYNENGYKDSDDLRKFLMYYPEYQGILDLSIEELKNLPASPNPYNKQILDPDDEIYPALMQEFTYMFVNVFNFPDHGQPGTSSIAFPIATKFDELGKWDAVQGKFVSDGGIGDFGHGLTTFDCNFDGIEDICRVHSEQSLQKLTGIGFDADGDGVIQQLDFDSNMDGNETVILAVEQINVDLHDFVMFLDHMVRIEDISTDHVTFCGWRTGGSTSEKIYPSKITDSFSLEPGEMMPILHGQFAPTKIIADGNNLGSVDGPWFIYLHALDDTNKRAVITVGRALGCTHTSMELDGGGTDLVPGDPWYMKRFYVDGHEYSVVAIKNHEEITLKEEDYEFKYMTIRTTIPKVPVIINQHSQRLQDYSLCMNISVMPPFNYEHTARRDIVSGWTECEWWWMAYFEDLFEWDEFMDNEDDGWDNNWDDFVDLDVFGEIIKNKPPLVIHINKETREPQFKGELKEKFNKRPQVFINAVGDEGGYEVGDGKAYINASGSGLLEGREIDADLYIRVTRTNDPASGDGDVSGYFEMEDNGGGPDIFNDNDLFYGHTIRGAIKGRYDHSAKKLHVTLYRDNTHLLKDPKFGYLNEWFLCFWAEFVNDTELKLNDTHLDRYDSMLDTPPIELMGGWDPADRYPEFDFGEEWEVWMVEQWHTIPDQYTELGLPDDGQLYLLTSSWWAGEAFIRDAWLDYPYGYATSSEHSIGYEEHTGDRVKFWYDPSDCKDIYVNTAWIGEAPSARKGDFDGNDVIDFDDFIAFADCYGATSCVDPIYNAIGDFNDDCKIDFDDFIAFADVYGT